MADFEITAEMNLKTIISETKEVAQALLDFADNLEKIEIKYTEIEYKEQGEYETNN